MTNPHPRGHAMSSSVLLAALAMFSTALLGTTATAAPELKGRLCLTSEEIIFPLDDCQAVEGAAFAVDPENSPRNWFWIADDSRSAAFGSVEAGATTIELSPLVDVTLQIAGAKSRGWPSETEITWTREGRSWTTRFTASEIDAIRSFRLVPGSYSVSIKAARHIPVSSLVVMVPETVKPVRLDRIELAPTPVLTGSVIDSAGNPLSGVAVSSKEGKTLAFTDALGRVEAEVEDKLPGRLVLSYPGLATRSVLVTNVKEDFDFGTQTLSEGSTLNVEVSGLENESATLRLMADFREPDLQREIGSRSVTPDNPTATFELLEPGSYELFVEGDEPWKRLGADVDVKAGAINDERLEISRHEVDVLVKLGGLSLGSATVEFGPPTYPGPPWKAEMTTDDAGRFRQRSGRTAGSSPC